MLDKVKRILKLFDEKSMQMSNFKFTLLILIISVILSFTVGILQLLFYGLDTMETNIVDFPDYSLQFIFIIIVLVGPYIETILFHAIPLGLYLMFKNKYQTECKWDFMIGAICGLIFGIIHGVQSNHHLHT